MRISDVLADLKSLLTLFGLVVLAILFVLCLVATVGMVSFTLSEVSLEAAPVLALVHGLLAVSFRLLFAGLLYWQVQFFRYGKSAKNR